MLASCGTGPRGGSGHSALRLAPPAPPSPAACAARELATRLSPDAELHPRAGVYRYQASGARSVSGQRAQGIPRTIELIATRATAVGRLRCFRLQRRYSATLGETGTFAIRGPWLYLTELELQAGGQRTTLQPHPPVLAVAPSEVEWQGSFAGASRGRYAARVIGQRSFTVGGVRYRAVGVEFELAAAGRVSGSERAVQWFDLKRGLPVAEQVGQDRRLGLDRTRLTYRARLLSLEPRRR